MKVVREFQSGISELKFGRGLLRRNLLYVDRARGAEKTPGVHISATWCECKLLVRWDITKGIPEEASVIRGRLECV
jgi:hypothetical protein